MTLTKFILTYQGKKVDFDGQYGAQCVDLYRQYCKDVLNISQTPGVDGAKDIWNNYGSDLRQNPDNLLADYSRGEILIWNSTATNKYGHVAILVEVYNTKQLLVFEQDGFAQTGARLWLRSRENLLGGLYLPGRY